MESNAHYYLPSRDACYVDPSEMPKLLRPKNTPNRHGINRMVQEGFMIRQSSIKDGKITIPAGGMICFENGGEYYGPLNGEPASIAGKEAYWVEQEEALVVKKNFFAPFRGRPVPLGEEGTLALQAMNVMDSFFGVQSGAVRFVFANGHPGWNKRVVLPGIEQNKPVTAVSSGYVDKEGMNTPPPLQYFGNPYDAHSSTYVVVDSVTPEGMQVKEAGVPEINWFKITYAKPIIADFVKEGQTVTAGDYTVKVLSCNPKQGTATLSLMDAGGKKLLEKVLGPLTLETYKVKNHIHHSMKVRDSLGFDYENIRVQLNTKYDSPLVGAGPSRLIDEKGDIVLVTDAKSISTFGDKTVSLVIYTDIEKIDLRKPWEEDPKFVFQTHYI